MSTDQVPVPTIDDLRVKLCYICHEEERYGDIGVQPQVWSHPCKCTLIAHEKCLLKWIHASEESSPQSDRPFKCPQCKAPYELESDNPPWIYKTLHGGHKFLQKSGKLFLVYSATMTIAITATGIYVICLTYGAWAVRSFMGKEMFHLCLGSDLKKWPLASFLSLPFLPFSLMLNSLTGSMGIHAMAGLPMLIAWPSTFYQRHRPPFRIGPPPPTTALGILQAAWPPHPLLFGLIGMPIIQKLYRKLYNKVYERVMGTPVPPYRGILEDQNEAHVNIGDGRVVIRVENEDGVDPAPPAELNAAAGAPEANANANANANNQNNPRVVNLPLGDLGIQIGGALLTPAIADWMGRLLLALSRESRVLRAFLGVAPFKHVENPWNALWFPKTIYDRFNATATPVGTPITLGERLWNSLTDVWASAGSGAGAGGTLRYTEGGYLRLDPVWWRNTIGLGLFVVVKDCLKLAHMYYNKREIESRRVKSRDFSGIDVSTLDLIPGWRERRRA